MLTTILVGSSASGKSTHAKTLNQVIYDNSFNMSQSNGVFKKFTKYFYDEIEYCIKNNIDFVIDRTNLYSEIRRSLILKLRKMAKRYGKKIIIKGVYFVIPENVIWQRLKHRKVIENKSIPSMIILEQIEKYELPTIDEGFDYLIKKL